MTGLIMYTATKIYCGWILSSKFLALINTYSTMQYFFAVILTLTVSCIYIVLVLTSHCNEEKFGGFLCMDPMDFIIEKFVHIVTISCVIGYRLDMSSQDVYEAPRNPQAARYNQQRSR